MTSPRPAARPPLARKHTRASKKKASDAQEIGLTLTIDGQAYTVRAGDLNAQDTMALRRETGFSFRSLVTSFATDPDIDLVAAIVWLARRVDGELLLSYADVATELNYDVDLDVIEVVDADSAEDADPEA